MVNYMANWHFFLCFLYKKMLSILSDNFKMSSEYFAETISNQNTQLINFTKLCQLSDTLDQYGHFLKRFHEILQSVNRFYGVSVTVIIIDFYLNSVIGFYYLYFLFINNWLFRDGKFSNSPFFYVTLLSVTDFISMCLSIYVYQSITIYSRNIKHHFDTTTNYNIEIEDRFERCINTFSMQLTLQQLDINACGLFTLDNQLCFAMISSIVSHLVVLIQFHKTT
ncbi:gustatory receptor for bitter taste 66a-like isoform X3 [Hermetia illucens]|uniref:gustatory receptor for bitter taste 66a-like isoform X3 n=1 Tax=Hermetia illucens TaxID=343691 RepID=UPI0018CC7748|nr:gustatory receptor for bitter taste 66a-like isoform X3 [Hermetia illucens]